MCNYFNPQNRSGYDKLSYNTLLLLQDIVVTSYIFGHRWSQKTRYPNNVNLLIQNLHRSSKSPINVINFEKISRCK